MNTYIATFFAHFGAIRFRKQLQERGLEGTLMPVPRKVSSSCGTCVRFSADVLPEFHSDDVEQVFMQLEQSYDLIVSNV